MPSFFISHDDAVWTLRIQNELPATLARLMGEPETFLSEAPHEVDRSPLVTSLWNSARSLDSVTPVYSRLFKNTAAQEQVTRYLRGNPNLAPADFAQYVSGLNLTSDKIRLFDPAQPVMVSVQYGPIVDLLPGDGDLKTVSANDELLVQGEYGTNFVRIYCPLTGVAPRIGLRPDAPVRVTLTGTNLVFVHFDLGGSLPERLDAAATLALYPASLVAYLNQQCASPDALEVEPLPGFTEALTPHAERAYGSFPDYLAALRGKLQFRLPDSESGAGAAVPGSYEFLYQANAAETQVSTCIKLVATLTPQQLISLADHGFFWMTLQSGQMVRWMIP